MKSMKKGLSIAITLVLLCFLMINAVPMTYGTGSEPPSGVTLEVYNTTRNATGLERYRHTIIVAQVTGTTDLEGLTLYLNITGAVTIHATSNTNSVGVCMWEWIPENLSTATINVSYNSTIFSQVTRVIYQETDVILELEHAQKYGLNNRLYMQLFAVSKVSYFEPSSAPYRIQVNRHNSVNNHTTITEWVGSLDNHGYMGFYVDLEESTYSTIDYEVSVFIYNNTGNVTESDTLIDSDGGTTLGRATQFESGNYLSFLDVYGPSSSLWWYGINADQYDVNDDTDEPLDWIHTVLGTIHLVNAIEPPGNIACDFKLSTASNYKNIYFNDTNENEIWDNDTDGEESGLISEDIWLDNGNGIWDGNESQEGYPDEGYNGTPFLRMYHTFKVVPGTGIASTTIPANTWTWTAYINGSSKTGATLYSELTNCTYLVMQNSTTGYYYTYGPGITDDFTVTYGSAVCLLLTTSETWDQK